MTSAPKETSAFLRALQDLLAGAHTARDMAEILVVDAVQLTLAKVCADYPLDYTQLVKKYQDDVVTQCCAAALDETQGLCAAITKTGKACGRRAVMNGACARHLDACREQQAAQRRQEAYAASRAAPVQDPHMHELRVLGTKRTVSMAFPNVGPSMY